MSHLDPPLASSHKQCGLGIHSPAPASGWPRGSRCVPLHSGSQERLMPTTATSHFLEASRRPQTCGDSTAPGATAGSWVAEENESPGTSEIPPAQPRGYEALRGRLGLRSTVMADVSGIAEGCVKGQGVCFPARASPKLECLQPCSPSWLGQHRGPWARL